MCNRGSTRIIACIRFCFCTLISTKSMHWWTDCKIPKFTLTDFTKKNDGSSITGKPSCRSAYYELQAQPHEVQHKHMWLWAPGLTTWLWASFTWFCLNTFSSKLANYSKIRISRNLNIFISRIELERPENQGLRLPNHPSPTVSPNKKETYVGKIGSP